MPDLTNESRKPVSLNTDWVSALCAAGVFVLCGLLGFGMSWTNLHGSFKLTPVSWKTVLVAGGVICLGIMISGKLFRTAVFVLAIGPVSRIILWLARASEETRLTNEIFIRWIDAGLCFAVCAFVVHWFKKKITHV